MGPIKASRKSLTQPLTFDGRASWSEYWGAFLMLFIAGLVGSAALYHPIFPQMTDVLSGRISPEYAIAALEFDGLPAYMETQAYLYVVKGYSLFLCYWQLCFIALNCRRLHDTGRSGWFQFAPTFAIIVGGVFGAVSGGLLIIPAILVALVLSLMLLVFLLLPGDAGRNEYGKDPSSGGGEGIIRMAIPETQTPAMSSDELRAMRQARMND